METSTNIADLLYLIAKCNDTKAFKDIYVAYYNRLFKLALHITKSEQYSEEIVSDVFLAIWQNREKLLSISSFELYLYKSVKNTALNYLQKYSKNTTQSVCISVVHYLPAHDSDPENKLVNQEIERKLQSAIDSLPEQCRIIFKLVYEDNLRYKQIAEILNLSVRTIDAQMAIARQKLRKIILADK